MLWQGCSLHHLCDARQTSAAHTSAWNKTVLNAFRQLRISSLLFEQHFLINVDYGNAMAAAAENIRNPSTYRPRT